MAASNEQPRPIIVRRKNIIAAGHHGGAWKVAYADFVTAMMAFFLLMWLLNATSEDQRKGLADYFNPTLPISRTSAGGAGMLSGETIFTEERIAGAAAEGVPPKPAHRDPGKDLGKKVAAPDVPDGASPAHADDGVEGADAALAGAALGGAAQDGADPVAGEAVDPDTAARLKAEAAEQARLERIGEKLAAAASAAQDGLFERHFRLRITPEGLVIEIVEADGEPLFSSASATPAPLLETLLSVLVPVLDETTNDIAVVGHTDAVPFGGPSYSNWELSADRANAARRLLTAGGLPESRIARVTGKAAVDPLAEDPNAPQNRRIAVTLLRNDIR